MHENSVEVSRLHGADLNGFLSPAHDLVGVDVGCGGKQEGGGGRGEWLMRWWTERAESD